MTKVEEVEGSSSSEVAPAIFFQCFYFVLST